MQQAIKRICELQGSWSNENTLEMQERGTLVRHAMAEWLRSMRVELARAMQCDPDEFGVQGKDGTGRKTETPWVRFYSSRHAPTPREGWYCVYLFHASGEGVYLSLGHGSTVYESGEFIPRSDAELAELATWGRDSIAADVAGLSGLTHEVDLGAKHSRLGDSYAKATAIARWYPVESIPDPIALAADALLFARLLGRLYALADLGLAKDQPPIEVIEAEAEVEAIARPLARGRARGGRQGIGLSAPERKAVELHAMRVAIEHLQSLGYVVTDVSAKKPFDLVARLEDQELIVEVKGSTGPAGEILLTAGEVRAHQGSGQRNGLLVVSMIQLQRGSASPVASGGKIQWISPWALNPNSLVPIAYRYAL